MRRIWRAAVWMLAAAAVLVAGLAVLLFLKPGLVLNERTLRLAAAAARTRGIDVSWREASVRAASAGFWRKTLDLQLDGVTVRVPAAGLYVTAAHVAAAAAAEVGPWSARLTDLGPARVDGARVTYVPAPGPATASTGPDWTNLPWPAWMAGVKVHPIHIGLPELTVQTAALSLQGGFDFAADASGMALKARCLCAKASRRRPSICIDDLTAHARLGVVEQHLRLVDLGPVRLVAPSIRLALGGQTPAAAGPSGPASPATADHGIHLEDARIHDVNVDIRRLEVVLAAVAVRSAVKVTVSGDQPGAATLRLTLQRFCGTPGTGKWRGCFSSVAASARLRDEAGGWRLAGLGSLAARGGRLVFGTGARRTAVALALRAKPSATLEEPWQVRVGASTALAGGKVTAAVRERECTLDLDPRPARPRPSVQALACVVHVQTHSWPGHRTALALPREAALEVALKAAMPLPHLPADPITAEGSVVLRPLSAAGLDLNAHLDAGLSGTLAAPPGSLRLAVNGQAAATVARFEDLVAALSATPYSVPAPFAVLKGRAEASATIAGDPLRDQLVARLKAATRLASEEQTVDVDATGTLRLPAGAKPVLAADVLLRDVQIVLPRLSLVEKPPQLFPDPRMAKGKAPKPGRGAPPSPLLWTVHVHTADAQAFRLVTNLAKSPVPIAIDLTTGAATPPRGRLQTQKVPLQLFRRDAMVDRFVAKLQPQAVQLDGLFSVAYVDYTVYIDVRGTKDAPIVRFYSKPPLPEKEISAVLLFGKDPSQLDAVQSSSSDNMRAAAADGALSLASLYLLASTPVESVGYDSLAKAFTARVALGRGTSLTLGSDFADYSKVELRRHLRGPWYLTTYVERRTDTDEQSATALLEWSKRY